MKNTVSSAADADFIAVLRDVVEVSNQLGIRTHIWGGLSIDIFEGQLLRPHDDIDGFIENLLDHTAKLTEAFSNRGYQVRILEEFQMLRIDRGDTHAVFNPFMIERSVAQWDHIGANGSVYFPSEWLDDVPREFEGIQVRASGDRFEYAFRSIATLTNPTWKPRAKDTAAITYLRKRLLNYGIDPEELLSRIWSYNPFWIDKGYDPFSPPVLVTPPYSINTTSHQEPDG
jgi:hypothetical protein